MDRDGVFEKRVTRSKALKVAAAASGAALLAGRGAAA